MKTGAALAVLLLLGPSALAGTFQIVEGIDRPATSYHMPLTPHQMDDLGGGTANFERELRESRLQGQMYEDRRRAIEREQNYRRLERIVRPCPMGGVRVNGSTCYIAQPGVEWTAP